MADQNDDDKKFTFEISLSVFNHLGRSLYRSCATVMREWNTSVPTTVQHKRWNRDLR
jgi:hypothetical protein